MIMPMYRYDIVKNSKIVYTTFSMIEAHKCCADNGGTIEITKI